MTNIRDLTRLSVAHGGPIGWVRLHRKPLWFSDCTLAVSKINKTIGVAKFMRSHLVDGRYRHPAELPADVIGGAASTGAGLAYDAEGAMVKAVCEGVERYCGQYIDPQKHVIVTGSYDELLGQGLDLPDWRDLSWKEEDPPAQPGEEENYYEVKAFNREAKVRWVQVKRLPDMSVAYAPILHGFLGIEPRSPYERICEQVSTGMACGSTLEGAIASGIYEVVERDAIMGMWFTRRSPPRISLESVVEHTTRGSLRTICRELLQTKYEVVINDLTSDIGIPIFFVTLLNDAAPYSIVGASCGLDADHVLEKALIEVMMGLAGDAISDRLDGGSVAPSVVDENAISSMGAHAEFYAKNDFRSRLAFLQAGNELGYPDAPGSRASESMRADMAKLGEVELLVRKLKQAGRATYYNDLTCDFAAELSLHVVKVLVPGLLPLYNRESNRPVAMARLCDYATLYERKLRFDEEFNPWPHPFP